jgi:tRNA U34 5-carboxymethylaminomethyl modifying GTPase MnmE/TrmE
MASETDTIYALATPPGKSAIAVIRISGDRAADVPGHLLRNALSPAVSRYRHWLMGQAR